MPWYSAYSPDFGRTIFIFHEEYAIFLSASLLRDSCKKEKTGFVSSYFSVCLPCENNYLRTFHKQGANNRMNAFSTFSFTTSSSGAAKGMDVCDDLSFRTVPGLTFWSKKGAWEWIISRFASEKVRISRWEGGRKNKVSRCQNTGL